METNGGNKSKAGGVDDVRRRWGAAVDGDAKESASIKSSAFAREDDDPSPPAPEPATPKRTVSAATGGAGGAAQSDRGDFVLGELLGKGGMGLVFRAEQNGLDRAVAFKTIIPDHAADRNARAKFVSEARATGQLDHPNIVPIYELAAAPDGGLFYTMKEVRGRSWAKAMPELGEAENIDILLKVADAVAFAHGRGVVHRDLKPENVMLGDYGEVLVMDWGLAVGVRAGAKAEALTPKNARGGTPAYMSPEMAAADAIMIGPRSDVYLLGAILYEILTGLRPHHGQNVFACIYSARVNTIQPTDRADEITAVAKRAMATDPSGRYPDAKSFQRAIRDCREHAASVALSGEARATLKRAIKSGDYTDYARSVFGFGEGLRLWPENDAADRGLTQARKSYAEAALERGDFDLALSQTRMMPPAEAAGLARRAQAGKAELARRRIKVRRLTQLSIGLICVIFVVLAIAYQRVSHEKERALAGETAALTAERKANDAFASEAAMRKKAESSEKKANDARLRAERSLLAAQTARAREREANERQRQTAAELAAVARRLGFLEETEVARVSLLAGVDDENGENGTSLLHRPIIDVTNGGMAIFDKAKVLAALSLAAGSPEDMALLAGAFDFLGDEAARESSDILAGKLREMARALEQLLPEGYAAAPAGVFDGRAPLERARRDPLTPANFHERLQAANPNYRGLGTFRVHRDSIVEVEFDRRDEDSGVEDLSPLAGLELTKLRVSRGGIEQLTPLADMPLRALEIPHNLVSDLNILRGMKINVLNLHNNPVQSVEPLEGMPLRELDIAFTQVQSLEPLKGMPLRRLWISSLTPESTDPLAALPLQWLYASGCGLTDLDFLIGKPLTVLDVGRNRIKSLEPLRGLELNELFANENEIEDMEVLRGMPLKRLDLTANKITSLEALRGMPLEHLSIRRNSREIPSFEPLRGMKLKRLYIGPTLANSLEPLRGMPLTRLNVSGNNIGTLEPLRGMELTYLMIISSGIHSIAPLEGMPLTSVHLEGNDLDSLMILKDMPLRELSFEPAKTPKAEIDMLREKTDLLKIGRYWNQLLPAEDFWNRYDQGGFD